MATYEEQVRKALQETEVTLANHMVELNKAGDPTFGEWLAYQQTWMQIQQTYLLLGIFERLQHGVPVYPLAT